MAVDINIANYETFLLSYIDGELNEAERAALEAFLQQHPPAVKELEILKATISRPDEQIVFGHKEMLYRHTAITLDNYETYFLDHIDGELNEAESAALQAFLRQHPHLEQELETWKATRLQAGENVEFENKAALYRHTGTVTPENYETYLLSYIDGELSPAETKALQELLQQHPQLQAELQLLKRTRLQPDPAIEYTGKTALYRQTQPARQVRIGRAWWWGAAAAVVTGILVWWLPFGQPNRSTGPLVTTRAPEKQPAVPAPAVTPPPAPAVQPPAVKDKPALAAQTPARRSAGARNRVTPAASRAAKTPVAPATTQAQDEQLASAGKAQETNTTAMAPVLTQLPQPRTTSDEVVQQHLEKKVQVPVTAPATTAPGKEAIMASSTELPKAPPPQAAAAPVQGELIMSVSSSNESKLLNGVANVARFFSRKKNNK